jgi:hypothetical protein
MDPAAMEPLVIAGQGHFFTGIRSRTGAAGTSVYGTHVQWQAPPSVRDNLIAAVITDWIIKHT